MFAGQPLGIEQDQRLARFDGNDLLYAEYGPRNIGGVNLQLHRGGQGTVLRFRNPVDNRHRLRRAFLGKGCG